MYNLVASNIAAYSDSNHLCHLPAVPLHLSCRLVSATTVVYISLAAGTKPHIEVQGHVLVKLTFRTSDSFVGGYL
jgi:hypothetical protein